MNAVEASRVGTSAKLSPMCSAQRFCWPWASGVIDSRALASQCVTGREGGLLTVIE